MQSVTAESEILSKTTVHSNVSSSSESDVRRVENSARCGPLLSTPRNVPKVLRTYLLPKPQRSSNQSDGRRELPHHSGFKVMKGRGQTRVFNGARERPPTADTAFDDGNGSRTAGQPARRLLCAAVADRDKH